MNLAFPIPDSALTNAIGHAAGAFLFGTFLVLAFPRHRSDNKGLALLAAGLALLWNVVSLNVLLLSPQQGRLAEVLAAVGFSTLSLLPAVLLQLCLRGSLSWVVRAGYGLGAFALACHLGELALNVPDLHKIGLSAITFGFGALTAFSVLRSLIWRRTSPAPPARSLLRRRARAHPPQPGRAVAWPRDHRQPQRHEGAVRHWLLGAVGRGTGRAPLRQWCGGIPQV